MTFSGSIWPASCAGGSGKQVQVPAPGPSAPPAYHIDRPPLSPLPSPLRGEAQAHQKAGSGPCGAPVPGRAPGGAETAPGGPWLLLGSGYGGQGSRVKEGPARGPGWRFPGPPVRPGNTTRSLTLGAWPVGYGRGSVTGAAWDRPLDYRRSLGGPPPSGGGGRQAPTGPQGPGHTVRAKARTPNCIQ